MMSFDKLPNQMGIENDIQLVGWISFSIPINNDFESVARSYKLSSQLVEYLIWLWLIRSFFPLFLTVMRSWNWIIFFFSMLPLFENLFRNFLTLSLIKNKWRKISEKMYNRIISRSWGQRLPTTFDDDHFFPQSW